MGTGLKQHRTLRTARIRRVTAETEIDLRLDLDRDGPVSVVTTIPFMDHMLTLTARHGGAGLAVTARGDTDVDHHHLVEDLGIVFGTALARALGDKRGIARYGYFLLPMDESLAHIALDLSGRPHFEYEVRFARSPAGFDYALVREFFAAVAAAAGMTLHMRMLRGRNNHHIAEALFKGFGRALAQAVLRDPRKRRIPSTKGCL